MNLLTFAGLLVLFLPSRPAPGFGDLLLHRLRTAVLLAGILALLVGRSGGQTALLLGMNKAAWEWLLSGTVIIVAFSLLATRLFNIRQEFPLYWMTGWTIGKVIRHNLVWLVYIFTYECFLRGWLLPMQIAQWGRLPAVIWNIVIYMLLHILKGRKEMIGSMLFGIVLCTATIRTGSVLPAIAMHSALALSFENMLIFYSLKHQRQCVRKFS